jgi:hypothetical protein
MAGISEDRVRTAPLKIRPEQQEHRGRLYWKSISTRIDGDDLAEEAQ